MAGATVESDALRVTLELWHPNCWVLETTAATAVGMLSYGVFTRADGRATTLFTLYADETGTIDDAVDVIRSSAAVCDVAEMTHSHRGTATVRPGNATRELLVDHDGTTQVANAFTSRGFVLAEPVDARDETEYWTLLAGMGRGRVERALDAIRDAEDAEITVTSVSTADRAAERGPLPLTRLSSRQREAFRLARRRGYYDTPRRTDAAALADELGVTTSTLHEHLRKTEARLLGDTDDDGDGER